MRGKRNAREPREERKKKSSGCKLRLRLAESTTLGRLSRGGHDKKRQPEEGKRDAHKSVQKRDTIVRDRTDGKHRLSHPSTG